MTGKAGTADEHQLAVALTFDFDAESYWLSVKLECPSAVSRGTYGAREGVPRILKLLSKYDSSQFAADRPYWIEENGVRTNLVEISIAVELTDSCHFMFLFQPIVLSGLSASSKVEEIWRGDFEGAYEEGGDACFILTMHPQIIGRHHRMQMLERFICYMLEHDGVWFAQLCDIADDFRKREK